MATSNAIAIKRLEQERDLKLQELKQQYNLKLRELELGEQNLAETIRNNLRNYNINLSKNQIQKIANDQLDERESRKILETVRHNLEIELETKRSNMAQEDIKKVENEIKRLDAILQGAKPVGKDAAAIALSAALNQGMLNALGLPTLIDMTLVQDFLKRGDAALGKGGEVDAYQERGIIRYTNRDGTVKKGILKGRKFVNGGEGYAGGGKGGGTRSGANRHYAGGGYGGGTRDRYNPDENEIPEDLTYAGPGEGSANYGKTNVNEAENTASSRSGTTGHQSNDKSEGRSYGESTGQSSSSKVYYSPGSQTGPGWFH